MSCAAVPRTRWLRQRAFLYGWFALNPQLELPVDIEQIDFPDVNRARIRLQVAAICRGAGLDVDGKRFVVELVDEQGPWRLLRASRPR